MNMRALINKIVSRVVLLWVFAYTVALTTGCKYDNEEEFYGKRICDTSLVTYTALESKFEQQCFGCHMASAPSGNVAIYDYNSLKAFVNSSPNTLLGSISHTTASPMPKGGPKWDECDIKKVEAWINQGMQP
jgi:hypothetical protein